MRFERKYLPHLTPQDPAAAIKLPIHHDRQFRRLWAVGMLESFVRWLEILAFGVFTFAQTQSAFGFASLMVLR